MSKENYCLYCQRRFPQIEWLKPLHNWTNGELEGYYCEQHHYQVKAFNDRQKKAYEDYKKNKQDLH
ncbi:hypothetical protein ACPOM7_17395 [Peribacillus castrilensis]|uniref:hypothetical protein n=1 Tax=Bacillaceae TaxID=186817 RepID=UPI0006604718|nr:MULTISPECIES: hypothetical protein [Bacillaceae]MCT1390112.1 hypothetical protein [Peribacillus frigoritolerans]PRA81609.1 hypothetical protein CQ056_20635 [Peribacillus simplex]